MNTIEVCLAPTLIENYSIENKIVVVVDILRATTIITTLFHIGLQKLIPVQTLEEARKFKQQGYLVAAERNGKKVDFADFGNSPFDFCTYKISNKTLVYNSTNGTNTINLAKSSEQLIIASFLNISSIAGYVSTQKKDILILCSGWMGDYCTEDFLFAGALSKKLIKHNNFHFESDAVQTAIDLWKVAESDLSDYIKKSFQYKRLLNFGFKDIVDYCFKMDVTSVIPILENECIVNLKQIA